MPQRSLISIISVALSPIIVGYPRRQVIVLKTLVLGSFYSQNQSKITTEKYVQSFLSFLALVALVLAKRFSIILGIVIKNYLENYGYILTSSSLLCLVLKSSQNKIPQRSNLSYSLAEYIALTSLYISAYFTISSIKQTPRLFYLVRYFLVVLFGLVYTNFMLDVRTEALYLLIVLRTIFFSTYSRVEPPRTNGFYSTRALKFIVSSLLPGQYERMR